MALVSLVHKGGGWDLARDPLHLVELALQRVTVEGIARAAHGAHHEAFLVRRGETGLHPELIRSVRLPLRDALHLGCVQAVDLAFGLPGLGQDELRENQRPPVPRIPLVRELPLHIPLHPSSHGLQAAEHLPGPFELTRLRVPSVLPEPPLHELPVALPELDALGLRDPQHRPVDLLVQPRVRRMLDRLRLHRCVHDDLLEAALRDGACDLPRRDRRLQQLLHALLADAATPPRHLRGMDREVVLEELLAAEVLPVGVLHPALHHLLVRQPVGVLQQVQPRHQANWNPWATQIRHIQASEFLRQILPGDHRRQPHQLMVRVQRQVQLPADHRLLTRRPPRFRLHPYTRKSGVSPHFLVYPILPKFLKSLLNLYLRVFQGRLMTLVLPGMFQGACQIVAIEKYIITADVSLSPRRLGPTPYAIWHYHHIFMAIG